jgi:hypothetical protein
LPEKDSKRDIIHGLKNLEEIAEDWLCARRTLSIISVLARKWKNELPEEASAVLARTDVKYGFFSTADLPSPKSNHLAHLPPAMTSPQATQQQASQNSNTGVGQNSLMESFHSYALPASNSAPNIETNLSSRASFQMCLEDGISSSSSSSPSRLSPLSDAYNASTSTLRSDSQQRSNPINAPDESFNSHSAPSRRRTNPSTLFGGVEMLIESQDSWLREQANLPLIFHNWMGTNL